MIEDIRGWMISAVIAVLGVAGWAARESQINKQQGKMLEEHGKRLSRLEDGANQRNERLARIEERQIPMARDLAEIKSYILKNSKQT